MTRRLPDPLEARLAAVTEALGLGPDPRPILDRVHHLYAALDADLAVHSHGLDLPCRPGCDACCHESVFLSAPEYLAVVAELLATRTAPELATIDAEMRRLADRFEDELELLETIEPGPERDEVAARVKFRCPLLGAGGACTIYPARELNARTFGQSWDERAGAAYGCELTHARLRVIGEGAGARLAGARAARQRWKEGLDGTERVHVYPWWFTRYPLGG